MSHNSSVNSSRNPLPGELYDHPNGEDVYKNCKIDYEGSDVTK